MAGQGHQQVRRARRIVHFGDMILDTLLAHQFGHGEEEVPIQRVSLIDVAFKTSSGDSGMANSYAQAASLSCSDCGHGFDSQDDGIKDPIIDNVFARVLSFLKEQGM